MVAPRIDPRFPYMRAGKSSRFPGGSGFILFEVMVALAVFMVSIFALNRQVAQSIGYADYLEQKHVALWLAQDTLTGLRTRGEWPAPGQSSDGVRQFGREWWVEKTVSNTREPLLRRVEVRVGLAGEEGRLVTLHGFIGRH